MIGAIVSPVKGCGRPAMAKCSGKVLSFTMEERLALWKSDERFPEWAWVYEHSMAELQRLMYCLAKTATEDGYQLEFVALYGPDNSRWQDEPYRRLRTEVTLAVGDEEMRDVEFFRGCNVTLICDAARKAAEFDTGRLRRFKGCESWRLLMPDTEVSIREEKAKAESMMAVLKEKELHVYQRLVDQAGMHTTSYRSLYAFFQRRNRPLTPSLRSGSEAAAIGEMTKRFITEAAKDNQHILVCRAKGDESLSTRFVRLDRSAPGYQETVVSGTIVRSVIEKEEAEMVKLKVGEMALSPKLLGQMMGLEMGTGGEDCGGGVVDQGCLETCTGLAFEKEESEKNE